MEGATRCPARDRPAPAAEEEYGVEGNGNINHFRHGLPSDVVEYIHTYETIRFARESAAHCSSP